VPIIKRHSIFGADLVSMLGRPELTEIARRHHERLDGGRYPTGSPATTSPSALGSSPSPAASTR
jgi:hypothetical protein